MRALDLELNSRTEEGVITRTSNEKMAGSSTSEVASSSTSSCDPGSPSQAAMKAKASGSVEVSNSMTGQSETPRTRTRPLAEALARSCNDRRYIPMRNNFNGKRRWRRGNRAPLTIMRADAANFQAMVQQMTGFPLEKSSRPASSIFKPQPKRADAPSALFKPQPKRPGEIGAISSCRLLRAWGFRLP